MWDDGRMSDLHDDELQHQWQLSDVTTGQVKQEWSVPDRVGTTGPFGLLGTNYFPILAQIDYNIVVCGKKITLMS